jgi:hypothetical protein
MYIAMRVLTQHDHIAASLSHRFDEVVVDEAQDTYSVQFACLDAMKANSLTSVVLVGDIDQAIYGWMGATPEGCEEFAARHNLTELPLTRNFRSSQAICNVTVSFSSRDATDVASGASADFGVNPEIVLYDGSRPADAVAFFLNRVEELGLDQDDVAVLVRTIAFAERVNGTVSANASRAVLALGEAAEAFQAGRPLERRMIQNLEDAMSEIAWGEAGLRSRSLDERTALRAQVLVLLELLPALAGNLQAWIAGARSAVASAVTPLSSQPAVPPGNRVRARPGDGAVDATTAFRAGRDDPRRARTIHSAKGESRDSVLLLAQRPAGGRDFPREWVQHLLGGPRTEETRIAYVALTRARRYIAVALPSGTPDEVVDAYLDAGLVFAE